MFKIEERKKNFIRLFQGKEDIIIVFFAQGRVNLIGEHTDYNGGFVFPAAIEVLTGYTMLYASGCYATHSMDIALKINLI